MTGITCAVAGSGSSIGTVVMTVGYANLGPGVDLYGYDGTEGSISPSTWGTRTITLFYFLPSGENLTLAVAGNAPNSGWTTMNIAGTIYNRVDASYNSPGSETSWIWNTTTNPFGTTVGVTISITWI